MRKINFFSVVICLFFVCSGCKIQSEDDLLSMKYEVSSGRINCQLLCEPLDLDENGWLFEELSKKGIENITVIGQRKDDVNLCNTTEQNLASVYLLYDYAEYGDNVYHKTYLAIEMNSELLLKDLETGSYGDTSYVCDVDGDNIDEIIVQQTVGMSGGSGQYMSRIFKVIDDEIVEIFSSNNNNQFDTGFSSDLKNNFKMEIKNTFTGYTAILDFTTNEQYASAYFDKSGKVKCNDSIWCDSFRKFIPEDVDNDGIFELVCLQYVSLGGHSNYIGDVKSYLKYNVQTNKFEIIQSEFILAKSLEDIIVTS